MPSISKTEEKTKQKKILSHIFAKRKNCYVFINTKSNPTFC